MSKTGRLNYRRGTKGTPKSLRRILSECIRHDETGAAQERELDAIRRTVRKPRTSQGSTR